jgi:hypothetical protein
MFGLSGIRLGVYACVAVLVGYLVWREHSLTRKVATISAERKAEQLQHAALVSQLNERIAIEIENRRKADEVSNRYQSKLADLELERTATPVRTVRLCNGPAAKLPANAASGAASGHHAAGSDGLPEASGFHPGYGSTDRWSDAGPDIGPELYALADQADKCAAQRDALQEWIRGR